MTLQKSAASITETTIGSTPSAAGGTRLPVSVPSLYLD